jgi:hypothetical protein
MHRMFDHMQCMFDHMQCMFDHMHRMFDHLHRLGDKRGFPAEVPRLSSTNYIDKTIVQTAYCRGSPALVAHPDDYLQYFISHN